jgi:hypothetical protein
MTIRSEDPDMLEILRLPQPQTPVGADRGDECPIIQNDDGRDFFAMKSADVGLL